MFKDGPDISIVLNAVDKVEKPSCRECRWFSPRDSMIMFSACERTNRLCMPVEAAKMLSGNYCPDDCPVLNERVMDLLTREGTLKEAMFGKSGDRERGDAPSLAILKSALLDIEEEVEPPFDYTAPFYAVRRDETRFNKQIGILKATLVTLRSEMSPNIQVVVSPAPGVDTVFDFDPNTGVGIGEAENFRLINFS